MQKVKICRFICRIESCFLTLILWWNSGRQKCSFVRKLRWVRGFSNNFLWNNFVVTGSQILAIATFKFINLKLSTCYKFCLVNSLALSLHTFFEALRQMHFRQSIEINRYNKSSSTTLLLQMITYCLYHLHNYATFDWMDWIIIFSLILHSSPKICSSKYYIKNIEKILWALILFFIPKIDTDKKWRFTYLLCRLKRNSRFVALYPFGHQTS